MFRHLFKPPPSPPRPSPRIFPPYHHLLRPPRRNCWPRSGRLQVGETPRQRQPAVGRDCGNRGVFPGRSRLSRLPPPFTAKRNSVRRTWAFFGGYVSYGIHHCVNVVTDRADWANGVLLRAVALPGEPERVAAGLACWRVVSGLISVMTAVR